jgi:hypothetical protein
VFRTGEPVRLAGHEDARINQIRTMIFQLQSDEERATLTVGDPAVLVAPISDG